MDSLFNIIVKKQKKKTKKLKKATKKIGNIFSTLKPTVDIKTSSLILLSYLMKI